MIIRIVKMVFIPGKEDEFIALFNTYKLQIANTEGCLQLQLIRDIDKPNVFFTYSNWISVQCLNSYRNSLLFKKVWPATRNLFATKAEVWTTSEIYKN